MTELEILLLIAFIVETIILVFIFIGLSKRNTIKTPVTSNARTEEFFEVDCIVDRLGNADTIGKDWITLKKGREFLADIQGISLPNYQRGQRVKIIFASPYPLPKAQKLYEPEESEEEITEEKKPEIYKKPRRKVKVKKKKTDLKDNLEEFDKILDNLPKTKKKPKKKPKKKTKRKRK